MPDDVLDEYLALKAASRTDGTINWDQVPRQFGGDKPRLSWGCACGHIRHEGRCPGELSDYQRCRCEDQVEPYGSLA
jgi:hypothetical protein